MSRVVALTLTALLLALAAPPGGALPGASAEDALRPLRLVLPAEADRTVAIPAHSNFPQQGAGIGPGSHLLITFQDLPGFLFSCTSNFVWKAGEKLYLGAAGHCFLPEFKRATHGPGADYDASGVRVRVCVAACAFGGQTGFFLQGQTVQLGSVAYARQTGPGGEVGNDFGLVEIPGHLHDQIRHSVPVWEGPTDGVREVRAGATICFYGHAGGFGETFATMARAGVGVGSSAARGSWSAALPSFQGDSGTAILTCERDGLGLHGRYASGVLTHLQGGLLVGTTMAKAKQMAGQAGLDVEARFPS